MVFHLFPMKTIPEFSCKISLTPRSLSNEVFILNKVDSTILVKYKSYGMNHSLQVKDVALEMMPECTHHVF